MDTLPMLGTEFTVSLDFMDEFRQAVAARGMSANTIDAYCQDVRVFAAWFVWTYEGLPFEPAQVTGVDLRAWREYSLGVEQVSPSTWNRRRSSLKAFCEWVGATGQSAMSAFSGVESAEEVELAPRWLEPGEQQRFMRQVELAAQGAKTLPARIQALRDAALVGVMIYAGLREGEAVSLRLGDVTIGERSGRVVVRRGKGDKKREIPLGKEARHWMRLWLDVRPESGSDLLFMGRGSDGMSTRSVQRRVAEIGRRANLEVTPHDLRHTCAKRMLDRGVPLTVVQRMLGHSRIDTTTRYVQPSFRDLEKAVEF